MDTNLKIWDNRKKGCIHTYKGHSQGISTIKFTPDGRWVVSGGFDNVVKVWDLTAGKLLHDFNFHDGHITSLDFHPLEFLLATGSADRTVKFWDLESFELIGSARREATGVRSMAFHPDGRTLFSGHEDGLKVFSWEPVICHDTVDMGWTKLGDLCIHDGKLLGCSYYRNSVGVWVADISLIEPYGDGLDLKKDIGTEQKHSLKGSKLENVEVDVGPTAGFRSISPDESKEIKNIYIDSSGGKPVSLQRSASYHSAKVDLAEESKEIYDLETLKQNPATKVHVKSNEQETRKSIIVPNIPDSKDSAKPVKETITFSKTKPGMLLKPAHVRRASTGRFDVDRFSDVNSRTFCDTASKLDSAKFPKFESYVGSQNEVKESCEDKHPIKNVTDKSNKTVSPYKIFNLAKRVESSTCNEEITPVKYVNGVAVVRGRTRSLVERFERREIVQVNEDEINAPLPTINEAGVNIHNEDQTNSYPTSVFERKEIIPCNEDQTSETPSVVFERKEKIPRNEDQTSESPSTAFERKERIPRNEVQTNAYPPMVFERKEKLPRDEDQTNESPSSVFERKEKIPRDEGQTNASPSTVFEMKERIPRSEVQTNAPPSVVFERKDRIPRTEVQTNAPPSTVFERKERIPRDEVQTNASPSTVFERKERIPRIEVQTNASSSVVFERKERIPRNEVQANAPPSTVFERKERIPRSEGQTNASPSMVFERKERIPRSEVQTNAPPSLERKERIPRNVVQTNASLTLVSERKERISRNGVQANASLAMVSERKERIPRNEDRNNFPSIPNTPSDIDESPSPNIPKLEPQVSQRDSSSPNEMAIIEGLMETHDVTLSNLRSRLTKLQVVRHFWERNDIKGAISALRKLPDQSVQADVISVLMEKMEILTLDLLASLLPVLTGLLDSKTERHVKVSLDMLLKFAAVFGSTITATISAPPSVGVDLHREQRRECCNECFMELQKVQTILPMLIRRGGLLAKSSMELNLVLQRS
ncbi:katanin p80 WD40 repeat-containing subunit B1 homolog KTN80.2 isoform X2 [Medicago truncatula]|nr:katanin p80 WD40 repeat-containing subunit B1 homolog KTN80.2 isoform X2 [Medicago truncatula]